jgi:hypothetical protein
MHLKKPTILGLAMMAAASVLSAQTQPIPIKKPQTPTYRSATDDRFDRCRRPRRSAGISSLV